MRSVWTKQGILIVLLALLRGVVAHAQYPTDAERYLLEPGAPTFNTPIAVPNGFVNLANGNLHIEIPIVSYPQRGGVPYFYKAVYDSRIWKINSSTSGYIWSPTNIPNSWAGWRFYRTGSNTAQWDQVNKSCLHTNGATYYWSEFVNYRYYDASGTTRKFPIYTETSAVPCHSTPSNLTTSGPSLDGSGMWMNLVYGWHLPQQILAPDGTKLFYTPYAGSYEYAKDVNGNYLEQEVGEYGDYGYFTDTLNHRMPDSAVGYSGQLWSLYPTSMASGTALTKVLYSNKTGVSSNFGTEDVANVGNQTITVVDSIVLGDTTSYSFTYDSQGTLASMTLPTGATINFTYTNAYDAQNNVNRYLNTVVIDSQTTTYTPSVCGSGCTKPTNCGTYTCNKMVVKQPNNDETEYLFNIDHGAWLTQSKVYTGSVASGTLLQTSNMDYENNSTSSVLGSTAFTRPIRTTVTLPAPGSTTLIKKSELTWETFSYDYRGTNYTGTRGNVTTSKEYKFGNGSAGAQYTQTVNTYLHTGNSNYMARNIVNRITNTQLQKPDGTKLTETITNYDDYSSPNQLTSVSSVTHHDTSAYGTSYTYRGNPTSIQVWTGGSNYLTTTVKYDITGQVVKVTNPRGKETTYSYTDSYFVDSGLSSPSAYSPTPPTTNAFVTSSTSPVSGTVTNAYYYRTGGIAKSTDVNGNTTTTSYYGDGRGRPVYTWSPTGALTSASYPSAIRVDIATPSATAQANFNALGKLKDTKITNDPQGNVTTETTYDPLGRVLTKTNPYRSTTEATYGVSTYEYDGLSRVKKVTLPDNMTQFSYFGAEMSANGGRTSQLCSDTIYGLGYPTMAKDEAGKKRQSWTDAFGRLIEADEPDSSGALTLGTCYKYDERGNLLEVNQGVQTRTNTYENSSGTTIGLGRLTAETTPEGGTVNLYYTTSGGALCAANPSAVCRSTDARSITTTFTYDDEDRLVSKSYSNSDPTVTYYYDYNCLNSSGSLVNDGTCSGGLQLTNGKGRRVGLNDGSGLSAWKYNTLGQVLTLRRKIGSLSKDIGYAYSTDGSLYTLTYPSGQVLYYTYRTDGKLQSITRNSSPYFNYVGSLNYAPQGALSTYSFGVVSGGFAGIAMTNTYNNRLQPVNMTAKHTSNTVTLMDYTYSFVASSINDGLVKQVTNNQDNNRTQTYTYDEMNRLLTAKTQATYATDSANCWGQSYVYDRYANLSAINAFSSDYTSCNNGPALSMTIDSYTNKITNSNFSYDNSGNLTASPVGYSYTWNADGRMSTAVASGVTYTYTYNGDGQRVKKAAGSSSSYDKLYWYGLDGEVLAESDLSGNLTSEYIFMDGARIARREISGGNVYYYLGDRLGNARLIADSSGTKVEESDFLPFGTERTIYNDSSVTDNTYKFTSHERDTESSLDHTLYRQYSSNTGRWLSADPDKGMPSWSAEHQDAVSSRGDPANPQSWNRYSYVSDNPTNRIDPFGLEPCVVYMETEGKSIPINVCAVGPGPGPVGPTCRVWVGNDEDGENIWRPCTSDEAKRVDEFLHPPKPRCFELFAAKAVQNLIGVDASTVTTLLLSDKRFMQKVAGVAFNFGSMAFRSADYTSFKFWNNVAHLGEKTSEIVAKSSGVLTALQVNGALLDALINEVDAVKKGECVP